jgi:hypothetical protein
MNVAQAIQVGMLHQRPIITVGNWHSGKTSETLPSDCASPGMPPATETDKLRDKRWLIEIAQSHAGDVGCANGYFLKVVKPIEPTRANKSAISCLTVYQNALESDRRKWMGLVSRMMRKYGGQRRELYSDRCCDFFQIAL